MNEVLLVFNEYLWPVFSLNKYLDFSKIKNIHRKKAKMLLRKLIQTIVQLCKWCNLHNIPEFKAIGIEATHFCSQRNCFYRICSNQTHNFWQNSLMPLVISPFPSKTMERSLLARAQCNKKYQKRVATVASFLSFIFHKFILTKRCNTVGCKHPTCQKMWLLLKDVGNEKRGRGPKVHKRNADTFMCGPYQKTKILVYGFS